MRHRQLVVFLLLSLGLVGCTAGPDYEEPNVPLPDRWEAAAAEDLKTEDSPLQTWWTLFNDTTLTRLIRDAEFQNLDLAIAVARVQEARAFRGIATGDRWPEVFLNGAYTRFKLSDEGIQAAQLPGDKGLDPLNLWSADLEASWEIDLFGRIRRNVEAATAELGVSVEDYRDVLVTLYAEVAASYVEVRTFQLRLRYAKANADLQGETVQLTQDRFNAGLTSALDVAQAESNLASTKSEIPSFESALNSSLNRLAVLLGRHPGGLIALIDTSGVIPTPSEAIESEIPVDLVRRRPDIRRAERQLAAQTARIGVAAADLYPRFSIAALFGFESIDINNFTQGARWNIVPGFSWNIFSGGKVQSNVMVQEARTEQLLIGYEQTILLALEDVENSIVNYQREKQRRNELRIGVDASQRSVDLVRTQYISGLTNFQNYLDTQRSLFQQQDRLAESEGLVVRNLIALNKAFGGGWTPPAEVDETNDQDAAEELIEVSEARDDESE